MTQYRDHRGGLADSMATVRQVASRAELAAYLGFPVERIDVQPYASDDRIGWLDTHIVTVTDWGVAGFTDGPLP